ncbi:MAG: hypothetical protein ACTHK8_15065 [Ginsengibacter sp.]
MATVKRFHKIQKLLSRKTILVFTFLVCVSLTACGQTVNGIPIKDLKTEYVDITGIKTKLFGRKVNVFIDFGQEVKVFGHNQVVIKDAKGEDMEFNSMIDALNFMSQNGYTFVQAYAIAVDDDYVYHYLMKKDNKKEVFESTGPVTGDKGNSNNL